MSHKKQRPAAVAFLYENSMFLIAGAIAALVWANVAPDSYHHFIHLDLTGSGEHRAAPAQDEAGGHDATAHVATSDTPELGDDATTSEQHGVTLHFLINDVLMALFFAIAGKEVWEALLPGGALSDPRKAATPLLATVGGVLGPAAIYIGGVMLTGQQELANGWAVPCATDIAFSYLVARMIFG
ncbi:MAG: Na+/H+ antiporter NhaA, partial [Planctomycetota bacterium]|nr:Na+/H+ antiporter NhaA [Planctomycetota bacterium]